MDFCHTFLEYSQLRRLAVVAILLQHQEQSNSRTLDDTEYLYWRPMELNPAD